MHQGGYKSGVQHNAMQDCFVLLTKLSTRILSKQDQSIICITDQTESHSFLSSKSKTAFKFSIFNNHCHHYTSWMQEHHLLFIHPLSNNLAPRLTFILHVSNVIAFYDLIAANCID